MADEEAAEDWQARSCMDLNLHVGLPPLPLPHIRLDTSAASPTLMPNSTGVALEAPRTGEPEESLTPTVVAHSSSIVPSTPEEHPTLDPIVYSWLNGSSANGEEYTDALESPTPILVEGANGLEGYDLQVERCLRPSRVATASSGITEMVNTSTLVRSTQGAAPTTIEAGAPEFRFLRAIEIHQQHNILRLGSTNPNQEAASADADHLARAIQHTQSSFEAARQNLDGGDNSGFECNICLELARQPVVTSCGHLFCWPCLYQWLHAQPTISECPVCKGEVLKGDITPIYGRGGEEGESTTNLDLPPRPQAHRRESLRQQLQMAQTAGNAREMARVLRQMIQNQSQGWDARSLPTPIVSEPGPSRRSRRPSESPTIRTRRRPQ